MGLCTSLRLVWNKQLRFSAFFTYEKQTVNLNISALANVPTSREFLPVDTQNINILSWYVKEEKWWFYCMKRKFGAKPGGAYMNRHVHQLKFIFPRGYSNTKHNHTKPHTNTQREAVRKKRRVSGNEGSPPWLRWQNSPPMQNSLQWTFS